VEDDDEEKPAAGFSLLSMFDRPAGQDEEDIKSGEEQVENNAAVRKAKPQVKYYRIITLLQNLTNQLFTQNSGLIAERSEASLREK
jgi:hypothetical protein